MLTVPARITLDAVHGIGEITARSDLAAEIAQHADLVDGDVVVVTSKVVSKAEGRIVSGDRDALVAEQPVRVVARRGATRIVRTRQGLTLAAAGLDASNTAPGTVVQLPVDPDASARDLRHDLLRSCGVNVAVVVSDTAGRPWREGQTDLAIGVAGLLPLQDLAGEPDSHGRPLAVTAPAVADELAAAADLVKGKLARRPVALVRGLGALVLPPDVDGPGAVALVRPAAADLFGWGAADAVRVAVRRDAPGATEGFPVADTDGAALLADAMVATTPGRVRVVRRSPDTWEIQPADGADALAAAWETGALVERLRALATSTRRALDVRPWPTPDCCASVSLRS
ncbi:MAG: coenzyme F420-0:L-glutamate ligase [Nocardioidaceae bacterium]